MPYSRKAALKGVGHHSGDDDDEDEEEGDGGNEEGEDGDDEEEEEGNDDEVDDVYGAGASSRRPGPVESFRATVMGAEELKKHVNLRLRPKIQQLVQAGSIMHDFMSLGGGVLQLMLSKNDRGDHVPSLHLLDGCNSLQLRMMLEELSSHADRASYKSYQLLTDPRHDVDEDEIDTLEAPVRAVYLRDRKKIESLLYQALKDLEARVGKNKCMDIYNKMAAGNYPSYVMPLTDSEEEFKRLLRPEVTMSQLKTFRDMSGKLKCPKNVEDTCKDIVYTRLMALGW